MATLSLTKNYADGTILFASDFDAIIDDLEAFLNVTKINDDNIQTDGITASTVFLDASVTTDKILAANITTAKIADGTISTTNINTSAVTEAKLASDSVTTGKLASSAVTAAKIVTGTVSHAKLLSNYSYASSGMTSVTSGSTTTFSGLSRSFTVVGNPVEIRVYSASSTSGRGCFSWAQNCGGDTGFGGVDAKEYAVFTVYRDSTPIAIMPFKINLSSLVGPASAAFAIPTLGPIYDAPGAGSYTYTVQGHAVTTLTGGSASAFTINCNEMTIFVREL